MIDGHHHSFSSVAFLVASIVFVMMVHFNGLVFQVPENGNLLYMYLLIPCISTLASLLWMYTNHKGVGEGGYIIGPIKITSSH